MYPILIRTRRQVLMTPRITWLRAIRTNMAARVGAVAGAGAVATAGDVGSRVAAQGIKALRLAAREEHWVGVSDEMLER